MTERCQLRSISTRLHNQQFRRHCYIRSLRSPIGKQVQQFLASPKTSPKHQAKVFETYNSPKQSTLMAKLQQNPSAICHQCRRVQTKCFHSSVMCSSNKFMTVSALETFQQSRDSTLSDKALPTHPQLQLKRG